MMMMLFGAPECGATASKGAPVVLQEERCSCEGLVLSYNPSLSMLSPHLYMRA